MSKWLNKQMTEWNNIKKLLNKILIVQYILNDWQN